MNATAADAWCCRIVELAARVLPADQRRRYALEFIAELHGMPRTRHFRHATQVLASAWALRSVLRTDAPSTLHEDIMTTTTPRPLRCLLRIHSLHWASAEDGTRYQSCVRCGRDKTGGGPGLAAKSMF